MHVLLSARRLVALAFGLFFAGMLQNQASAESVKVKFDTIDQVELQGTFYPGSKGKKSPCVLLLHKFGSDSQQDGWVKLAEELQKNDFAVLSFDFRGHGNSTAVGSGFWDFPGPQYSAPPNRTLVRGFNPAKPKTSISHKDFLPGYQPHLVHDIAAAKLFLEGKNDAGECNVSSLILVGAEDGAVLGLMWMASECFRYKVAASTPMLKLETNSEAKDFACTVWLSFDQTLPNRATLPLTDWFNLVGKERKVPMGFLYADGDSVGSSTAKRWVKYLKDSKAKKDLTAEETVRMGGKLLGHALLTKDLDTQALVVKYLKHVTSPDERGIAEWEKREVKQNAYLWDFKPRGYLPAKQAGDRTMNPIPLERLGVR